MIMNKITLKIDGMHCDACSKRLENSLMKKEHIKKVSVSFEKKEATIEFETITKNDIEEYIEDIGFKSLGE